MGLFSGLLGGVASAIGGLFGGGEKKTTTTSTVDYVKMVKNAQAAGFNPLTALRNGGAAGFSTTTASGGGPTFGSALAQGVSAGVNTWLNHDPMKERRSQAEYDLINAQLRNLDAETDNLKKYGSLNPAVRTAGQVVSGTSPASRPEPSEIPGMWVSGKYYPPQPGESPAQVMEDNHGGIWGEVDGARTGFNRFVLGPRYDPNEPPAMPRRRPKNIGRKWREPWAKPAFAQW